jgi:glucosamine 6-phosphate synthetase-like amidotransferase/phosphosugar isomerase protein
LWKFSLCWFLILIYIIILARFAIHFFKKLECFNTIQTFDAADFNDEDIPQKESGALFISQSGETRDIYLAL